MENRTDVSFYRPQLEDLWFRESLMADPETMSYNNALGNDPSGAPVGHSPQGENEVSESIEASSGLQRQQEPLRRLRLRNGTIPFPREKWEDWFEFWVENPNQRFYRYITSGKSRSFVGEAAYHYDEELQIYLADVIIAARCRRKGYGKAGLELLCDAARKAKIPELYDNIAIDNPGIQLFLQCGFHEEYRTEEIIMLKRSLG